MSDERPFSMTESAVAVHEMFVSLVGVGFTEWQALYLVAQMFRPQQGPAS